MLSAQLNHVYVIVPSLHIIIVNPWNVLVNGALELTGEESSLSTGVENPKFLELLYGRNFPILSPDTPPGDSGSGLDSSNDDGDSQMSDIVVCTAFLAHAKHKIQSIRGSDGNDQHERLILGVP
ncbi:unnamed protein product [Vicia faba]|uniref:Uncharacterized protein n=1 Tax=Vicia faba TaxID=3906 RepID=A0AAV0YY85_VICFA|nr:unnamed protein product [Vicia faba]